MKIKSKKGHGLALISVALMGIFYFFIFQSHNEAYEFDMLVGAEQNSLIGAYYYPEFALEYVKLSAKTSAFETMYQNGVTDADCDISKIRDALTTNKTYFEMLFSQYTSIYNPELLNVDVTIPDYYTESRSFRDYVEIEGFGYQTECDDITDFPEQSCIDIVVEDECTAVRACNINFACYDTPACEWQSFDDEELPGICTDATPTPVAYIETSPCYFLNYDECSSESDCKWVDGWCDPKYGAITQMVSAECSGATKAECEAIVTADGSNACTFGEDFRQLITATSPTLMNFQFDVYQDAHFSEKITCEGYNRFYEIRSGVSP